MNMIPIYKSTLTRLDLSSVLSYMVDNAIEGESAGQLLAKEIARITTYKGYVALRNPVDAIVYVMELMGADSILLPILCPFVLSSRLEALGKHVQFYDVDIDTMSPIIHHDMSIEYSDTMLRLSMGYFGGVIEDSNTLPQAFLDIPKIEMFWSLEKNMLGDDKTDDETTVSESSENRTAFRIMLLEHNTLCTAGGGAILLLSDKKHAATMKKQIAHLDYWMQLTDFNAGLALTQLRQYNEFVERVEKIVPLYKRAVGRSRHAALPIVLYKNAIPQVFPIMLTSRINDVVKYIRKQGVSCVFSFQHSTLAIMLEMLGSDKEAMLKKYPHATKFVTNLISVPLYAALEKEEIDTIVKVLATLP